MISYYQLCSNISDKNIIYIEQNGYIFGVMAKNYNEYQTSNEWNLYHVPSLCSKKGWEESVRGTTACPISYHGPFKKYKELSVVQCLRLPSLLPLQARV